MPEEKLGLTLRYLGGGRGADIRDIYHISKAHFYKVVDQVLAAIVSEPSLALKFPNNLEEYQQTAAEFYSKSQHGVMRGCVGAIDGWLLLIRTPKHSDVDGGNVRKYFSGHYQTYGINIQACCDVYSRFTAVNMSCPGSTSDAVALLEWKLNEQRQSFPYGFYLVGDNAYPCCNNLLTPFTRPQRESQPYRDAFCFYLSQLRIRIEMAFGLLVMKFQIFKKPLVVPLSKVKYIVLTCMILHNYIINERLQYQEESIVHGFRIKDFAIDAQRLRNFPFQNFRDVNGNELSTDTQGRRQWHSSGHPDYELTDGPSFGPEDCTIRDQLVRYLESNNYLRPN